MSQCQWPILDEYSFPIQAKADSSAATSSKGGRESEFRTEPNGGLTSVLDASLEMCVHCHSLVDYGGPDPVHNIAMDRWRNLGLLVLHYLPALHSLTTNNYVLI